MHFLQSTEERNYVKVTLVRENELLGVIFSVSSRCQVRQK